MIGRRLVPTAREAAPILTSAGLFALAFPPFPFVMPVFLCLVPLAVVVADHADGDSAPPDAARPGFWFGILGYGCNVSWMATALARYTPLAVLGYIATIAWIALWTGLAAAALLTVRRYTRWPMAILLPIVWVALEVALNYLGDLAFPWLPLGLALARHPVLAQLAELSGVRGVSFWIAATGGLLTDAWLAIRAAGPAGPPSPTVGSTTGRRGPGPPVVSLAAAVALALVVTGYGAWRIRTLARRPLAPVAVVQPNRSPTARPVAASRTGAGTSAAGVLSALTRVALDRGPARLVVWPEAALPGYLSRHPEWTDTLQALGAQIHTPLLFGVLDATGHAPGPPATFNAAMISDAAGRVGAYAPYHKAFLVPFVEHLPFAQVRWLASRGAFGAYAGGYVRGGDAEPYTLAFGRAGILICFEAVFPQRSRAERRSGAEFLANITDDAWFGRSLAPYQHASHLALRAIENRVGIVRAANSGVSMYVDPLGRVHDATPLFAQAVRIYDMETTDVRTLYVRFGDWIGTLSAATTLLLATLAAGRPSVLRSSVRRRG